MKVARVTVMAMIHGLTAGRQRSGFSNGGLDPGGADGGTVAGGAAALTD
jgi:hypothetical protein